MNHSLADTPVELRDKKCREKKREKKKQKKQRLLRSTTTGKWWPVMGGKET